MFDDVLFPIDISYGSTGGPRFSTEIVVVGSGAEYRNQNWSQARAEYNAASGLQSQDELAELISFFYARRGRTRSFRYRDWSDYTSAPNHVDAHSATDQIIGTGDGIKKTFQLKKVYPSGLAAYEREITKPVAGKVLVAVQGIPRSTGWSVNTLSGLVTFDEAPASGDSISAGFEFDVPVRFDTDTLSVSLDDYQCGSVSVPIVEVRNEA